MKDISSLKKKLAGYSAMAGVMIAANHNAADAQVIYHDIVPDTFITDQNLTYYLDMNNDGTTDFWWENLGNGNVFLNANSGNALVPSMDTFDYKFIGTLGSCQTIFEYNNYVYSWSCCDAAMMISWYSAGWSCPWQNASHKFAPVKLHLSDGDHYGWIRMTHHWADTLFIEDYAYEATPDSAIVTPCPTSINDIPTPNPLLPSSKIIT